MFECKSWLHDYSVFQVVAMLDLPKMAARGTIELVCRRNMKGVGHI